MNTGKALLGVLAGIAVGALVGTLLAPDKGSETRKKILRKGDDYLEDVKDHFTDLLRSLKGKFEEKSEDVHNAVAKGKSKYNDAKTEFKNSMAEM